MTQNAVHSPRKLRTIPTLILSKTPREVTVTRRKWDEWRRVVGSGRVSARRRRDGRTTTEVVSSARDQVRLDVERAFCYRSGLASNGDMETRAVTDDGNAGINIREKRERLFSVIVRVLERNPRFTYYQVRADV